MVAPYISKLLIDEAYPARDVTLMHVLVLGVLTLTVASGVIGSVRAYYSDTISSRVNTAANLMFFNHLQHLPVAFFDDHRVGELVSRFQDLSASLRSVSQVFETVLLRGTYLLLVPPVLFLLNWKLALLSVVTLPITIAVSTASGSIARRYWKESAEAYAGLNAYQLEVLSNIRTFKSMAAEHRVYRDAHDQLRRALRVRLKASAVGSIVGGVVMIIRSGGVALFTWFAWTLILRGQITLGTYIAFTLYQAYLVGPLTEFASLFVGIQQSAVSFGRTFEYLDMPTEQDPTIAFNALPAIRHRIAGALRLDHVSFGYAPSSLVLHELDLDIPAGGTTAIVGPSGAGKSSLIRLVCRMADPTSGTIRMDGVPLHSIPLVDLRRQVSVVWQEVGLTRGTIRDNLTIGVDSATDGDIDDVVRVCCLEDLIRDLPNGYETQVAEWGASLSGGQRQRIAIARALLRRSPILLLDEATSNLDGAIEAAVIRGIFARLPRPTLLFATHRLATAETADRIVVLDGGRIVGVGAHSDLLTTSSRYRDMCGQRSAAGVSRRSGAPASGL
jgi:ABC-type bacteriocin/lantibiotic exporter with double-glycine peptidase domain